MVMFILGMLVWQVVTAIVYLISEDDEKGAICGSGICILIWTGVYTIIRKIRLHKSRKYNLYQFFSSFEDGTGRGWISNYYMTAKDAERFNLIDRNACLTAYSVRLLRTGKEFKSVPPKNEILTAEMIENGTKGLTKDFLKKFLKNA